MKTYLEINNIKCQSCKTRIKEALLELYNINSYFILNTLVINSEDLQNTSTMLVNMNYNYKQISKLRLCMKSIGTLLLIPILLICIYVLNRLNIDLPNTANYNYFLIFILGIVSGSHCVFMCGAIMIKVNTSNKNMVLYNLGRITSYSIVGLLLGAFGTIFIINKYINAAILITIGLLLFLTSFNVLDINKYFPSIKINSKLAYIVGLCNVLMPCGILYILFTFVITTASPIKGMLTMFIYALGTSITIMIASTILNNKKLTNTKIFKLITTIILCIMSISLIYRGIGMLSTTTNIVDDSAYLSGTITDNIQYIEYDLKYSSYEDLKIKANTKVILTINAKPWNIGTCNNTIKINDQIITLHEGINTIELYFDEIGNYTYTCYMDMIKANIIVVDEVKNQ